MCGRFTLTSSLEDLMEQFSIINSYSSPYEPSFNIAPSHMVTAVIGTESGNRLGQLKWGLIPSWATDKKIGNKMINARAETLLEKRSFKPLVSRHRCGIVADSIFEWKTTNNGKRPFRILRKDEQPFLMAGLWDMWIDEDGKKVASCTIITTSANKLVQSVHDRMPAILTEETSQLWLNQSSNSSTALDSLQPLDDSKMKMYEVSTLINSPKNNSSSCIEEIQY
jgi:putative SOS response-associated peptidase YedK